MHEPGNLAATFLAIHDYTKAIDVLLFALEISKRIDKSHMSAHVYSTLGRAYEGRGKANDNLDDINLAIENYRMAYELFGLISETEQQKNMKELIDKLVEDKERRNKPKKAN